MVKICVSMQWRARVICGACNGTGWIPDSYESGSGFFGEEEPTIICPSCSGSGVSFGSKCAICNGKGRISTKYLI
jgi:DnaJ-class molecular chaperone